MASLLSTEKLFGDESIVLEKAFLKMFFATRDNKEVEKFWLIYFMTTTNMKDYILEDNEELRKDFRDTMDGQVEHAFVISLSVISSILMKRIIDKKNRMVDDGC